MPKTNIHSSQVIPEIKQYLLNLQDKICQILENEDTHGKFKEDRWKHENGTGGGQSRVLEQGRVFEKAGVNFSHVTGESLPASATASRPQLANRHFEALGLSLVIHPDNPFIPTTHMNIRFFIAEKDGEEPVWWFGGGYDLTPYYANKADCIHWHLTAKSACDPFGNEVYSKYKQWCDQYFFLKHRNETRGIGGIFFDDLNLWDFNTCFEFLKSVGDSFTDAYLPIVQKRKSHPFTEKNKQFQRYRRGRYAEFNLLFDRGTLFGIQSGGRTESILMSLPPHAEWHYNWKPEPGSLEEELYLSYLSPQDWI